MNRSSDSCSGVNENVNNITMHTYPCTFDKVHVAEITYLFTVRLFCSAGGSQQTRPYAGLMLLHPLRRWPNLNTIWDQRPVFMSYLIMKQDSIIYFSSPDNRLNLPHSNQWDME